jgi:hypothetical protein
LLDRIETLDDASIQLMQRKASESMKRDENEEDDTDEETLGADDTDLEEDDISTTEAALVSSASADEDSCDALDEKYPELVKVDFQLAENTINNLGGVGPNSHQDQMLYYTNAAMADDGKTSYDLQVTVIGNSYTAITPQVNGQNGHYGVINVGCGTSVDLKFQLIDPNSGAPATLKNLIFSWFDLDKGKLGGGLETVLLWPGYEKYMVSSSSEIITEDANCPANAGNGACKLFKASTWGVGKDNPSDPMILTKQQAARTFATYYSDVSSFRVTLTASEGFGSRNFLFTGMSQVAYGSVEECCPAHICGCQSSCQASNHINWEQKCEHAKCADCNECTTTTTTTQQTPATKEETCENGLTFELSEEQLQENTLGKQKDGRMLFKNVLQHQGRSIDLSITDAATAPRYILNGYDKFVPDKREYTGAYKNAGRLSFETTGNFVFRFTMLDSQSGEPAKLPLFPVAIYDIDGRGELVTACNVAALIKHEKSRLIERHEGQCSSHLSRKKEVNIPADFDSLTLNQKKHSITLVYKNTASWDLAIRVSRYEDQRYVLFKSSKVLACDFEDKVRDKPWKNKEKIGDA